MRQPSILLVEDEPITADCIREELEALGYATAVTASGESAIAYLEDHYPHLVLMDYYLPGSIDGIQTADYIRERRSLPVLFVTAFEDDLLAQRRLRRNLDYLVKPVDRTLLQAVIGLSLENHRLKRSLSAAEAELSALKGDKGSPSTPAKTATPAEKRYAFIANTSREFMTLINRDYVYEVVNQSYCRAHEKDAEEIVGGTVASVWGDEPFDSVIKGCLDRCFAGEEVQYDAWFKFSGPGRRFYSVLYYPYRDHNGEITHAAVVSRDITERKVAEDGLAEREALLRTLIANAGEGIGIVDEDERFAFANPAAAEIFGVPRNDLIGRNLREFTTPEQFAVVLSQTANRRNGKRGIYELEVVRPDGTRRAVRVTGTPRFNENGRYVGAFGIFSDITSLKEAERQRSESESRYRTLFETIPLGVGLSDRRGRIISWNPWLRKMLGYTQADLGKITVYDVYQWPGDRNAVLERLGRGEPVRELEMRLRHKTGRLIDVSLNVSVSRYLPEPVIMTVVQDISERKRTQRALKESEAFLNNVFESIQDGIRVLDLNFRIVRGNATLQSRFGDRGPVEGRKCYDVFFGGWRTEPCEDCPCRRAIDTGRPSSTLVPLLRPDGSRMGWLELYGFPLYDPDTGELTSTIEYVRDVTDKKLAEDQLRESLAEREVLLREIHHRVKNNLNVIISLIDMMDIGDGNSSETVAFEELKERIRAISLVHEDLYGSEHLSRIDAASYIRRLASDIVNFHGLGTVDVTVDVASVELSIETAIPCGLIVTELLTNALKYAFPEDGGFGSGEPEIRVRLIRERTDCVFWVDDNGVGLPDDFDWENSSSLGLRLVRILTRQLRGELGIDRRNGTRFSVRFPCLPQKRLSEKGASHGSP